jgi:hypothetical protein
MNTSEISPISSVAIPSPAAVLNASPSAPVTEVLQSAQPVRYLGSLSAEQFATLANLVVSSGLIVLPPNKTADNLSGVMVFKKDGGTAIVNLMLS